MCAMVSSDVDMSSSSEDYPSSMSDTTSESSSQSAFEGWDDEDVPFTSGPFLVPVPQLQLQAHLLDLGVLLAMELDEMTNVPDEGDDLNQIMDSESEDESSLSS